MSRWGDSTGTILYWPDRAATVGADDVLSSLAEVSIRLAHADWNNPVAWLGGGSGVFIRLQAHHPRAPQQPHWGGVDWGRSEQAESVLHVAETLALRTRNRWYALCDYEGWDDACTRVVDVPSFDAFP